jgi:hypothetical protein
LGIPFSGESRSPGARWHKLAFWIPAFAGKREWLRVFARNLANLPGLIDRLDQRAAKPSLESMAANDYQ